MWSYQVNLEKRVQDDHPLRRINRGVGFEFCAGPSGPYLRPKGEQVGATGSDSAHDAVVVPG